MWNEELDIIGRKKERKKTTSHPHLTRLGKIIGLSLLLIPLGIALLGAALDSNPRFSSNPDWYLTVTAFGGMALILCPLLTYFICKQLLRFEKARNWLSGPEPPPDPQTHYRHLNRTEQSAPVKPVAVASASVTASASASKPKQAIPQIEHMLLNRIMTEENTVTTKTPDPTAIEFEEVFTHLMRDALAESEGDAANEGEDPGQRRLVLVLDNLDRIGVKEALSIWSTLQSFLKQPQNEKDVAWFTRVWIIVPYDRGGLSALWQKDGSSEGATAASFMDKSFQLRFEVPEPVRSEWRRFLVDRLKEAFPDHDGRNVAVEKLNSALNQYGRREEALSEFAKLLDLYTTKSDVIGKLAKNFQDIDPAVLNDLQAWLEEFETKEAELHNVYRVLAIHLARQNKIPTIRELKLCVNQMGGIHRQWCEGFPLSHIAYFVMLRRPSESEVNGVDIVKALLEGAIIDPPGSTVTSENAEAFPGSALRRTFPEEEIVELLEEPLQDIRDNLAALSFNVNKDEARQLLLKDPIIKALTFAEVESLDLPNPTVATRIEDLKVLSQFKGFWEVFQQVITSEWAKGESENVARAIYCLHKSAMLDTSRVQRSVKRNLEVLANKVRSWSPLTTFKTRGLVSLFQLIEKPDFTTALLKTITLELMSAQAGSEAPILNTSNWPTQLHGVNDEPSVLSHRNLFRLGVYEPLMGEFRSKRELLGEGRFQTILMSLLEFSQIDSSAAAILHELAGNGEVLEQLDKLKDPSDASCVVCLTVLLGYDFHGLTALRTDSNLYQWTAAARTEIVDVFVRFFMRYGDLGSLIKLIGINDGFRNFSIKSLQHLSERHDSTDEQVWAELDVDLETLKEWWPALVRSLWSRETERESKLERFSFFLVARTNIIGQIQAATFDPDLANLYGRLYTAAGKPTQVRDKLIQHFTAMPASAWVEEISKNGPVLKLALDVARADEFSEPVLTAEPLEQFAEQVARGVASTDQLTTLGLLLGKDTPERELFRRKLVQVMSANLSRISDKFFRIFTSELAYRPTMAEDASVLFSIFSGFISWRSVAGLRWMSDFHFDWLSANQLTELASQVRAAFTSHKDDAAYPYLFPIAVNLNLSLGFLGPSSIDPRNYDEVDEHAARYGVNARKIVEVPGIQGLKILKENLKHDEFYDFDKYLAEAQAEKVAVFTGSIRRELDQLKNEDFDAETRAEINARLSEVLRKVIAENEPKPS